MTGTITYRDDEIVAIFSGCKTPSELDQASRIIGYLNIIGAQTYRPVVSKLYMMRATELKRKA
ncbi:hypothetical protein ACFFVB_18290 [Formosa undariae]|uniref:Uncharacterized protein n=1 Tax=Formosa undariae TaxID=1325436 RepID=A0ABV5F6E8_9FLAO